MDTGSSLVRLGMANMYIGRDGSSRVLPNMGIDSSLVGYGQHGYLVWSCVIRSLTTLDLLLLGMTRVVFLDYFMSFVEVSLLMASYLMHLHFCLRCCEDTRFESMGSGLRSNVQCMSLLLHK